MHRLPTFLLLSIAISGSAWAQGASNDSVGEVVSESLNLSFDKGMVSLDASGSQAQQLDDGTGAFQPGQVDIGLDLPIYSKLNLDLKDLSLWRTMASVRYSLQAPRLDSIGAQRRLHVASAGASALYAANRKFYWLYAGVSFGHDSETLGAPKARPLVAGIGSYDLSKSFSLLYGGAYSNSLGQALALPLLGLQWSPKGPWSTTWLLPLSGNVRYQHSKRLDAKLQAKLVGQSYGIANDDLFVGEPGQIDLRSRELQVALQANYATSPRWKLSLEAGVSVSRNISFENGGENLANSTVPPGFTFALGAKYYFGAMVRRKEMQLAKRKRLLAPAQKKTLTHSGRKRRYLLYRPENKQVLRPLFIVLHGGYGDGTRAAESTMMHELATARGALVAYPDGIHQHWNDGRGTSSTAVDDVGFVRELIATLVREEGADPARVFVSGMSNGGFMTARLRCEISDLIAGAAVVVATLADPLRSSCSPSRAVPMLFFNGTKDDLVPYQGGEVTQGPGGKVLSTPDAVQLFRQSNSCSNKSVATMLPDLDPNDGTRVEHTAFVECAPGADLHSYRIVGGTHSWPGSTARSFSGASSKDINASQVIVDFFLKE